MNGAARDARPLVVCSHVGRSFGVGSITVAAVRDASCAIAAGQQIALMGPSGSGKSTFIHLLAGLDTPTTGEITWPAIGDRQALRPGPVGVIFQAPSLLAPLDVLENVALPLLLAGSGDGEARRAAADALTLLDLGSLAHKLPEELSGGQAQRVAIARVVAGRAQLVFADEPTGQLDHESAHHVITVLLQAVKESGAALVVNTHDPLVATRLPMHWTMNDGLLGTNAVGALNPTEAPHGSQRVGRIEGSSPCS